jgi:glycine C-acetyltransferase
MLQIKDELTEDDVVVVICPDHGSRYLDKIYNESWMIEYGYNQVAEQVVQNTQEDILARKPGSLWKTNHNGKFKVIRSRELNNHNQLGMDLFDKIKNNPGPLGQYADQAEGYFIFPNLEGELSSRMQFRGKEVIVWSVNNYLGMGNHPEIRKADADATEKWGLAYPMGSRMMSGNSVMHDQLENELAEFVRKPAAVLVNFGYQGIMSAIDCLTDRRDVIVYDAGCHACIIDGVRMNMGKRFAFEHNDIESVERCLKRAEKIVQGTGGAILVISEGVFGMRGEQGILKEIVALKSKYNFRFLVDDAHGFGTLGEGGRGAGIEQGVQDEIDIYFSTFAKSMASMGAFLASTPEVTQFMKYNMRSQIFAKSLPMPIVEGALKRLDMLRSTPGLKDKLWENVNMLQGGLKERGFDLGNTNSCVTPVYMHGSVAEAMKLVFDLREVHRIFCSIVVYPVIPKGLILLRLIPTAAHNAQDIEETLVAFSAIKAKLDAGEYKADEPKQVAQ